MFIILLGCQLSHRNAVALHHIMDQTHTFIKDFVWVLSVSPAIWQNFINKVLDEIPNRKHFLAIMDDCMIHSKREDHLNHLIALLKTLIRNRLKIYPRKFQLFHQKLTYIGQTLLIKENTPCIIYLILRVDAIQRLETPNTSKECKKICELINYKLFVHVSLESSKDANSYL